MLVDVKKHTLLWFFFLIIFSLVFFLFPSSLYPSLPQDEIERDLARSLVGHPQFDGALGGGRKATISLRRVLVAYGIRSFIFFFFFFLLFH